MSQKVSPYDSRPGYYYAEEARFAHMAPMERISRRSENGVIADNPIIHPSQIIYPVDDTDSGGPHIQNLDDDSFWRQRPPPAEKPSLKSDKASSYKTFDEAYSKPHFAIRPWHESTINDPQ